MAAPVRTLVLDDHRLMAQALAGLLCELCNLQLVAVCTSMADAVEVIERDPLDLLILDVERHPGNWQPLVMQLLRHNPRARFVVLTAGDDQPALPAQLAPALLTAVDKNSDWSELLMRMNSWQRVAPAPALLALECLSPRERRVFLAIGRGLLNKQIGQRLGLSVATVETYRKSISAKLGLSGVELVRAAVLHRVAAVTELQRL